MMNVDPSGLCYSGVSGNLPFGLAPSASVPLLNSHGPQPFNPGYLTLSDVGSWGVSSQPATTIHQSTASDLYGSIIQAGINSQSYTQNRIKAENELENLWFWQSGRSAREAIQAAGAGLQQVGRNIEFFRQDLWWTPIFGQPNKVYSPGGGSPERRSR
jgi:hypothetical protein